MTSIFSTRLSASIFAALSLAAVVSAAHPALLGAQEPDMSRIKDQTAGEVYKNLAVLRDLPATEIHPAMEYITMALGVRCSYCHASGNFASDQKTQKRTARNMMKMMFALDNTAFGGKLAVTCFTCHRGAPIASSILGFHAEQALTASSVPGGLPAVAVPIGALDSTMSPVPTKPEAVRPWEPPLPSADEILSKYISALGGAAAIQKMSSLVEKGKVEMAVPPLIVGAGTPPPDLATVRTAAEVYRKTPDKWVSVVHTPAGAEMEGFDGTLGWLQLPNRAAVQTGGELAVLKESAEFVPALHAKENYTRLEVEGIGKVGDRDAYCVLGFRKRGIDRLYFDTQTGLLLRSWTSMDSVLGSFPQEINFENYREVSGVKIPFTIREASPEGDRVYQWDDIGINIPVEDSQFAFKPPATSGAAAPMAGPSAAGTSTKP